MENKYEYVNVIGGGLAGCEAAYQIAKRGIKVKLYEMKPIKFSPAHSNKNLAEIVCSNSFKSNLITNACGLLKEELRRLDSLLIRCADATSIPAGQALAVDREKFSEMVTNEIENNPNIKILKEEVKEIPKGITIIATGPLTSEALSLSIQKLLNTEKLFFYDAAAPIVTKCSINMDKAFTADRYGKGESDYINCPMTKEEYELFYNELINAEVVEKHSFENGGLFEGCMPIEEMARRGSQTLTYGPLKPVGFDKKYYAVVQLRQDNSEGTLYNLVGFQTNLKFGEQKRVFSLIPALENAEFVRYGVMHRNTYIDSPKLLDATYNLKNTDIYFAGQISGVEGYVESISSGMVAALNAIQKFNGGEKIIFNDETMIGSLAKYISTENKNFQPMNANFGIFNYETKIRDKKQKYEMLAQRSLKHFKNTEE
ncbi:MAG: methylenetetrahydrofolate--tRNA-(uracil(54)-C(5))-methyltransferase (FADH(2)-oxidizing) TrmFO [Clostridia bacterium]|nr:methylenetetrahydrofolate--tRNA-(uracil(54)-C(5))-methyltransferase (FADH(2)-oxidizing) TrmFO [Clostridia bacterium]